MCETHAQQVDSSPVGCAATAPEGSVRPDGTPLPWIATSERMPPSGEFVLAWIRHEEFDSPDDCYCTIVLRQDGEDWSDVDPSISYETAEITHWMPLPAAP